MTSAEKITGNIHKLSLLKLLKMLERPPRAIKSRIERSLQASKDWDTVRDIEEKNQKLDSSTIKKCREYAKDIFGSEIYSTELAIYCIIYGSWCDGWIPESWFQEYVVKGSAGSLYKLSNEKTLSNHFFKSESIPDVAYFVNGRFYSRNWRKLSEKEVKPHLFENGDRVVFKKNASKRGRGVQTLSKDLFSEVDMRSLGNGCFQSYIEPHHTVPSFGVTSVPTLRIVTTLDRSGVATPRIANLRLGRIHNTHVISDDQVLVPICIESGRLKALGYLGDWTPLQAHPDTNLSFHGEVYPEFTTAVELCLKNHEKVPMFLSIGWDVCLNINGSFDIMEWNLLHGIKYGEAIYGPTFSDLKWERDFGKNRQLHPK